MPKKIAIMGLFTEVGATADALEGLRLLGLREEDMSIIQGVPYTSKMLGRPHLHEFPWFSILGALGGFATALFLTWGTLMLYPIRVGGRRLVIHRCRAALATNDDGARQVGHAAHGRDRLEHV